MSASRFLFQLCLFSILVAFLFPPPVLTDIPADIDSPTLEKSFLLCPLYPASFRSKTCNRYAPSLFVEERHYNSPVLGISELSILEKKLSVPAGKKTAFEFLDSKFKALSKSKRTLYNLTLVFEMQNLFMRSTALLHLKNTQEAAKEKDPKKKVNELFVKPVLSFLSDLLACYSDLGSKATSRVCDIGNLFALHQFLDQGLFPLLTTLPLTASHPLVHSLTHVDEGTSLRRWIVLDVALQTLLRQADVGLDLAPFKKAFDFPPDFYKLSTPSVKQLQEASLRCYQSLQRVGLWVHDKKSSSPFQFMLLKSTLTSFLTPHLEKLFASTIASREDL